jgi:phosphatidate cytidylyltransferase
MVETRQRRSAAAKKQVEAEDQESDITDLDEGAQSEAEEKPQTKVAKSESKMKKALTRLAAGWALIFGFYGIIFMGHGWVTWMLIAMQCRLFKELVSVRYKDYKRKREQDTGMNMDAPRFRTIQWLWFAVAMTYSYGEAAVHYALIGDRKVAFEKLLSFDMGSTAVIEVLIDPLRPCARTLLER